MTIKKTLATLFVLSICGIYSQAQADTSLAAATCHLSDNVYHVALKNVSTQDIAGYLDVVDVGSFGIELTDCPVVGNKIAESGGSYNTQYVSLRYTGNTNDLDSQGNLIPIQDEKSAHGVAIRLIGNYGKTINLHDPDSMPKARLSRVGPSDSISFYFQVQYQATDIVSPGYIRANLPFEIIYR